MANTPSIRLERLCAVNERQLEFSDTASGPSHEPKFHVTATVGHLSASAEDLVKKRAKHKASNDVLKMILEESKRIEGSWTQLDDILEGWDYEGDLHHLEEKANESRQWRNLFNSIGALAEFCAKKKIPLPMYEDFTLTERPPLFKCVCSFNVLRDGQGNHLVTEAEASVKKAAKKKAADRMYELLRQNGHLDDTECPPSDKQTNCPIAPCDDLENSSFNQAIDSNQSKFEPSA